MYNHFLISKKKKNNNNNNNWIKILNRYFSFKSFIEHNHSFIRDEGAIPIVANDLSNPDNEIVITTAMTIAKLAKQGNLV